MSGVLSNVGSNVIPFRKPEPEPPATGDVDLLTAVDAAIRDLRDIARGCEGQARARADECRHMLERAFGAAVAEA